ncbi:MAG: Hsp20 family protein [Methanobacterium sp.]
MKDEFKRKKDEIAKDTEEKISRIRENAALKKEEITKDTQRKIDEAKENSLKKREEIAREAEERINKIKKDAAETGEGIKGKSADRINKIKENAVAKKEEITKETESKINKTKENAATKKEEITKETQRRISETKENATVKKEELRGRANDLNEKIHENEVIKSTQKFLNEVVDIIRQNPKELGKSISNYYITQKPLTDIIETNEALIVKMDLPDLNKEDLKVDIGEDKLYIKAEYPKENASYDINFIQKERNHDSIMKTIPIPANMEFEEAKADFNSSVLTITIPRKQKESYNLDINS